MQNGYHTQPRSSGARRRRRVELGRTEGKRLVQLGVSVALFLAVFVGKGVLPKGMSEAAAHMKSVLRADTDFVSAFSQVGDALESGAPVLNTLGDFCVAVFGTNQETQPEEATPSNNPTASPMPSPTPTESAQPSETPQPTETVPPRGSDLSYAAERERLAEGSGTLVNTLGYLAAGLPFQNTLLAQRVPVQQTAAPEPVEADTVLPVGAVVEDVPYTGDALPENVSMAWLSLGALETQDPIQGVLTSSFSYRTHPIDGTYRFHYGTDIAANTGTAIGAFADGTVEFVGKSDSYGLYVQVDHGSGIKSFYAHCSKICVQDGQRVKMGEKIAEVGETGNATGPHLHLQLKLNGTWLNPIYYLNGIS